MKKIVSIFAVFAFFFSVFAQNMYYDYQDGLVIFQLKEQAKIINTISPTSRVVDYGKEPLFKYSS